MADLAVSLFQLVVDTVLRLAYVRTDNIIYVRDSF